MAPLHVATLIDQRKYEIIFSIQDLYPTTFLHHYSVGGNNKGGEEVPEEWPSEAIVVQTTHNRDIITMLCSRICI